MSLHSYRASRRLVQEDESFYALLMAAMRRADTTNQAKLRLIFPEVWEELQARYNAEGGLLPGEPEDRLIA